MGHSWCKISVLFFQALCQVSRQASAHILLEGPRNRGMWLQHGEKAFWKRVLVSHFLEFVTTYAGGTSVTLFSDISQEQTPGLKRRLNSIVITQLSLITDIIFYRILTGFMRNETCRKNKNVPRSDPSTSTIPSKAITQFFSISMDTHTNFFTH